MCRNVERRRLKGEGEQQTLYRFDWEGRDVTRVNTAISITAVKVRGQLHLDTGSGGVLVGRDDRLRIGRDPTCDLIVDDPRVSRFHATLEWHRGRFVLKDHSTNGSFVQSNEQSRAIFIRREELPLTGDGRLMFAADDVDPSVSFRYE
ncbi:MAG: FHA domain-containing protein [Gammaproteobacteria bacterium]|nr:FHA domain-containing protein [Gammaproteobacteria bacterium]